MITMIGFETFLIGLMVVSTLTGLITEAIKKIMVENNVEYKANTLSGVVSLGTSAIVGLGYVVLANVAFTSQTVVCLIALALMSWLCAMVGYDKVVQVIGQFKTTGKG